MTSTARTARNQVPAIFRKVLENFYFGRVNFDIGGGPYERMTDALAAQGVINLVYDPENRHESHNNRVITTLARHKANTCTISNVLCVLKTKAMRREVLELAKKHTKERVYITVYEGDRSGIGKSTRDGYQNNHRLRWYLKEIREVFPEAWMEKGVIVCNLFEQKIGKRV